MTHSLSIIDKQKSNVYRPIPHLVHHIRGRVRFRIYRLKDDSDYAANLKQFLLAQPSIERVRVNRVAASIVINYRYTNSSLAEIVSNLTKLIQQAANYSSKVGNAHPTPETENWSSLRLPVFTTIVSWLSSQSGLVWLQPVALASLVTVTLPILKRASQSLWSDRKINIDCLDYWQ